MVVIKKPHKPDSVVEIRHKFLKPCWSLFLCVVELLQKTLVAVTVIGILKATADCIKVTLAKDVTES